MAPLGCANASALTVNRVGGACHIVRRFTPWTQGMGLAGSAPMVTARTFGLWVALVVGCGGNVEGGSSERGSSDGDPNQSPGAPGSEPDGADTELGSCKQGRKEDWRDPCPWVADGRCYDDREMACNCACPRSRNSQCTSGFDDGPDGHVWVSCN
jgi:hypothetical protein